MSSFIEISCKLIFLISGITGQTLGLTSLNLHNYLILKEFIYRLAWLFLSNGEIFGRLGGANEQLALWLSKLYTNSEIMFELLISNLFTPPDYRSVGSGGGFERLGINFDI